jgi:hypothetical protein
LDNADFTINNGIGVSKQSLLDEYHTNQQRTNPLTQDFQMMHFNVRIRLRKDHLHVMDEISGIMEESKPHPVTP